MRFLHRFNKQSLSLHTIVAVLLMRFYSRRRNYSYSRFKSCRSPYEIRVNKREQFCSIFNFKLPFSLWDSQKADFTGAEEENKLPFSLWDSRGWRMKFVSFPSTVLPFSLWDSQHDRCVSCFRHNHVAVLLMRFDELLFALDHYDVKLPFSLWDSSAYAISWSYRNISCRSPYEIRRDDINIHTYPKKFELPFSLWDSF